MTVDEFNSKYKVGEPFYHIKKGRYMGTVRTQGEAFMNSDGDVLVKINTHVFAVQIKYLTKVKPK